MDITQQGQLLFSGRGNGATFDDLPPEMLLRVVESIPSTETGTLHSLSSVTHRLHQLVEPYLYHTIQYDVRRDKPLYYLLRTLLERPALALCIKAIEVIAWEDLNFSSENTTNPRMEEIRRIRSAMANKSTDFYFPRWSRYWTNALSIGVDHAAVALLLFIAPNVESIDLRTFVCSSDFWFVQLLLAAFSEPESKFHELLRLKTVKLGVHPIEFTLLPANSDAMSHGLSPFFRLPALTTLEVEYGSGHEYLHESHWQQRTSPISTLIFNQCEFSAEFTQIMICACQALKTFEWYSKPFAAEHAVAVTHRKFSLVSSALQHHQATLERLVISSLPAYKAQPPTDPVIHTLHKFSQLKTLRVALDTILGRFGSDFDPELSLADALPPNLEELELEFVWGYCGDPGIVPCTLEAANYKLLYKLSEFAAEAYRFPYLKVMRLLGRPEALHHRDEIAAIFKKLGVVVTTEQWPTNVEATLSDEED